MRQLQGESRWALWSLRSFFSSVHPQVQMKSENMALRYQCSDRARSSVLERWFWQQVCVTFVLCLFPCRGTIHPKILKETSEKKLILLLTEFTLTSLPGCFWRSVSSSGSADMISHNVTLGYHQPQCRSHTSREQRWATHVGINTAHCVRASVHHQMAVEIRLPGSPSGCPNQHSFLQLA